MAPLHRVLGFAVVGGLFLLFAWGAGLWLTRRLPGEWFWRLLSVLQVVLGLQVVAGLVLLALGRGQSLLHYLYGGVFPVTVLVVAHVLARGMQDERDPLKVFTVASFVAFGLTLRALATGLGIG